jgi:hypothetical protein
MSKWKNIKGVDLEVLKATRKALHQAVQIVGALPRHLLPHDPTDGTASLEWSNADKGLQSIAVPNSHDLEVRAGLSFKTFSLYIIYADNSADSFGMTGKSVVEGLDWLKEELGKMAYAGEKLTLDLPYEIEDYDYSSSLEVDKRALKQYTRLYRNTHGILSDLVNKWDKAFDIRCWPHHFDLATLIPVETDAEGEIVKSIGVGLSPGDDGIHEPYLYVNVWPEVDTAALKEHSLPAGHWNAEGWSGAVLTYTELVNSSDQKESFTQFIDIAIQAIREEQG